MLFKWYLFKVIAFFMFATYYKRFIQILKEFSMVFQYILILFREHKGSQFSVRFIGYFHFQASSERNVLNICYMQITYSEISITNWHINDSRGYLPQNILICFLYGDTFQNDKQPQNDSWNVTNRLKLAIGPVPCFSTPNCISRK